LRQRQLQKRAKEHATSSRSNVLCFSCVDHYVTIRIGKRLGDFTEPSRRARVQTRQVTSPDPDESSIMRSLIAKASLLSGLLFSPMTPAPAQKPANNAAESTTVETNTAAQPIPGDLENFSGMLIGKLVDRDIEHGNFTVKVDYVARVWENNKSRQPRSAVGKTLRIDGVTGKWIDQLLLVRPGETVEFEAQHRGGKHLTFPGEWLKEVPPFDAADHPVPPDGFRGFAGVAQGKIVSKRQQSREIVLKIDSIEKTFDRNRARKPKGAVGKRIVVAGFWARMSKPFDSLKEGDTIRAGVLHRVPQSDHFTVIEFAEKLRTSPSRSTSQAEDKDQGFPAGMRGFRGILRGKLISRDIEKGELVFRAERATRTWKANLAKDTKSCRGRDFLVRGITGKWLDVLLTLEPGDPIEVEAFHNGGEHLDFISEWLKKVE
jgi:hypothetical protein